MITIQPQTQQKSKSLLMFEYVNLRSNDSLDLEK